MWTSAAGRGEDLATIWPQGLVAGSEANLLFFFLLLKRALYDYALRLLKNQEAAELLPQLLAPPESPHEQQQEQQQEAAETPVIDLTVSPAPPARAPAGRPVTRSSPRLAVRDAAAVSVINDSSDEESRATKTGAQAVQKGKCNGREARPLHLNWLSDGSQFQKADDRRDIGATNRHSPSCLLFAGKAKKKDAALAAELRAEGGRGAGVYFRGGAGSGLSFGSRDTSHSFTCLRKIAQHPLLVSRRRAAAPAAREPFGPLPLRVHWPFGRPLWASCDKPFWRRRDPNTRAALPCTTEQQRPRLRSRPFLKKKKKTHCRSATGTTTRRSKRCPRSATGGASLGTSAPSARWSRS